MDKGDHIFMTEILAQLNMETDKRDKAQSDMTMWIDRMALAKEARDRGLWEAAREKALECEEKVRAQDSIIMELEVERDNLKRKASEPKVGPGLVRANHLMEQFKEMGIDPSEEAFRRLEKKSESEIALDRLKERMGDD